MEDNDKAVAIDLHFVPVHGSGFIPAAKLYQAASMPFCVIADLNYILGEAIYQLIELVQSDSKALVVRIKTVSHRMKEVRPEAKAAEIKADILAAAEMDMDWRKGDDNKVRGKLESIRKKIYRMRRARDGGIEAYKDVPDVYEGLRDIVSVLSRIGIFLVPVGELENWVPSLMTDYSVDALSKPERAFVMAEQIRKKQNKDGDIWDFMKAVAGYFIPKPVLSSPATTSS